MEIAYKCIAYPCTEERAEGSGFCPKHLAAHKKLGDLRGKYSA